MNYHTVIAKLKTRTMNRDGFTFLMAIFMVMIIGVMLGLTGKSWTMIMKREREKELIFRGSQIKEAIENWNNPKYTVNGVKKPNPQLQLMDLKDLLDQNWPTPIRYLPHSYAAELDSKNSKCAPDCPKLKVYQDPMTGKEWTIIRGIFDLNGNFAPNPGGGIAGVASKSNGTPFRTNFKDTALENIVYKNSSTTTGKYSNWRFIAEPSKNDHTKIYRAYHEGW